MKAPGGEEAAFVVPCGVTPASVIASGRTIQYMDHDAPAGGAEADFA
jgi:hypothetical protein